MVRSFAASTSSQKLDVLSSGKLLELSQMCRDLAFDLEEKLDALERAGIPANARREFSYLQSFISRLYSKASLFSRQAMLLIIKTNLAIYEQQITASTTRLNQTIADLQAINSALGVLADAINIFVGVLDVIAGGGIVSVAGTIEAIDSAIG